MKKNFLLIALFIISFYTRIIPQWELRYPDIPTDHINDIFFLNEEKGFIVNDGGSILKTSDAGLTWKIVSHFQRNVFTKIKFLDDKMGFALSPHSVIGDTVNLAMTTNGGDQWNLINIGMSVAIDFLPLSLNEFIKSNQVSLAWLDVAIERYDSARGVWIPVYDVPRFWDGELWVAFGDIIQFQKLTDKIIALGASQVAKNAGRISDSVSFFLQCFDNGFTWDTLWCDLPDVAYSFYFLDDRVGWLGLENDKIYKTTDGGITWFEQYSETSAENHINSIHAVDENHVFAVNQNGKVIYSTNGGSDWQVIQVGDIYNYTSKIYFLNNTSGFLAGQDFWKTTNGGTIWERVSNSLTGQFWKIDFIDENYGMGIGEHIYGTTDGGYSWKILKPGNNQFTGLDMIDRSNAWVVGYDTLYKTTDGGITWSALGISSNIEYMRGIKFLDQNTGVLFEVIENLNDTTVNYVTTDGGNSWQRYPISNQPFLTSFFKLKFTDPAHLWFVNQQGIWLSRDTAKTWEFNPMNGSLYSAFDFADTLYGWFAVSDGQQKTMKFTTDGGKSWTAVDKPYSNQSMDLIIYGKDNTSAYNILVAGYDGSLFRFNEGSTIGFVEETYTQNPLFSFASFLSGNRMHVWVAGHGMTVLHADFLITDIDETKEINNLSFLLLQNYPNPFNPSTTIKYHISQNSFVVLKVFDVLGNEISTLVNEVKTPGEYDAEFNAINLSSGIYFYQLKAGSFIETKKMILLK
ncbi:MAG: hypothetical protein STSR0008_22630 [Ignavibacterium sp.]